MASNVVVRVTLAAARIVLIQPAYSLTASIDSKCIEYYSAFGEIVTEATMSTIPLAEAIEKMKEFVLGEVWPNSWAAGNDGVLVPSLSEVRKIEHRQGILLVRETCRILREDSTVKVENESYLFWNGNSAPTWFMKYRNQCQEGDLSFLRQALGRIYSKGSPGEDPLRGRIFSGFRPLLGWEDNQVGLLYKSACDQNVFRMFNGTGTLFDIHCSRNTPISSHGDNRYRGGFIKMI